MNRNYSYICPHCRLPELYTKKNADYGSYHARRDEKTCTHCKKTYTKAKKKVGRR